MYLSSLCNFHSAKQARKFPNEHAKNARTITNKKFRIYAKSSFTDNICVLLMSYKL